MFLDQEWLFSSECRVAKIEMSDFHFAIAHSTFSAAVSRHEILEIDGTTSERNVKQRGEEERRWKFDQESSNPIQFIAEKIVFDVDCVIYGYDEYFFNFQTSIWFVILFCIFLLKILFDKYYKRDTKDLLKDQRAKKEGRPFTQLESKILK